ncbi:MAG TPA: class I SAM-dependent methyltransferase [bacterium]|nr:class I SAM-dependent methyltransferase [bacterium]
MDPKYAAQILQKNITDYDQIAPHFSTTRFHNWGEINKIVAQYVKPKQQILDIGCGNGRLVKSLPTDIYYHGIDTSLALIELARHQYSSSTKHLSVIFQTGSILDIPSDYQHFDLIFSIAVLHHIPSSLLRKQACREMYRVLKPNGFLIMTNWDLYQDKYMLYHNTNHTLDPQLDTNDTLIPWKDQTGKTIVSRYYHAYSMNELKDLLIATGFHLIKNYMSKHNIITICQKGDEKFDL